MQVYSPGGMQKTHQAQQFPANGPFTEQHQKTFPLSFENYPVFKLTLPARQMFAFLWVQRLLIKQFQFKWKRKHVGKQHHPKSSRKGGKRRKTKAAYHNASSKSVPQTQRF